MTATFKHSMRLFRHPGVLLMSVSSYFSIKKCVVQPFTSQVLNDVKLFQRFGTVLSEFLRNFTFQSIQLKNRIKLSNWNLCDLYIYITKYQAVISFFKASTNIFIKLERFIFAWNNYGAEIHAMSQFLLQNVKRR